MLRPAQCADESRERERSVKYLDVKVDSEDPKPASQRLEAMRVLVSCSEFRLNRQR